MQKSTNDKNQHMVNEKFILREVLMKKKLLSLLLASAMVVSMQEKLQKKIESVKKKIQLY